MHRTGPRGLGRSYIDGLQKAIAQPDVDLVCQMDADLSHNPEYLPALAAATADSRRRHRLALPQRRQRRELAAAPDLPERVRQPLHPRWSRSLTPRDCTSGFRCWRRESLARLPLDDMVSDGYAFLVEMLFEASRARLPHRRSADHLRRAAPGPVEGARARSSSSR